MPKYSYIARTSKGEKETGVIEGPSQDDVVAQLQSRNLLVTSVMPLEFSKKKAFKDQVSQMTVRKFAHTKIKQADLVLFARQLAMLLGAGVNLLRTLDIISQQVDSKRLFEILEQVRKDMEGGRTLRDSLAKYPDIFTPLWVNLIETGEASGNLPLVLDKLAYYLEESASFRTKIISALTYPAILLFVSLAAVFFFIVKIVPTFANILNSFGVELPAPTRILIGLSDMLREKFLVVLIVSVGIGFLYKKLSTKPPLDRIIENIKFRLPVFGDFFRFLLLERFATTMAILTESGVPILYALEISERSAGSLRMAEVIQFIKTSVREGHNMAMPMSKSPFFTPMVIQMVAIGEEIGELSSMLNRIAKYYQEYLAVFVTRLASVFEPIMIVFIGIIIGAMVISIFMPIFSMAMMKTA